MEMFLTRIVQKQNGEAQSVLGTHHWRIPSSILMPLFPGCWRGETLRVRSWCGWSWGAPHKLTFCSGLELFVSAASPLGNTPFSAPDFGGVVIRMLHSLLQPQGRAYYPDWPIRIFQSLWPHWLVQGMACDPRLANQNLFSIGAVS